MLVRIIGPNGAPALVPVDVRGGTAGLSLRTFGRRVDDGTYTVVDVVDVSDDELEALEAAGYANEVDLDDDDEPEPEPEADVATTDNEPAVDGGGFAVTVLGDPELDTPPPAPKRRGRPPKAPTTE